MNIIDFIPSKDVRKYLKDIDYKLNMMQAFMLVWVNYDIPLAKKDEAYKYIADNYDDMEVAPTNNGVTIPKINSFKSFVKDSILADEQDYNDFITNSNGETYVIYEGKNEYKEFSNYNDCYKYVTNLINETKDGKWIYKRRKDIDFDHLYNCDDIRINGKNEIIRINVQKYFGKYDNTRIIPYHIPFYVPSPFKRGDIITEVPRDTKKEDGIIEKKLYCIDRLFCWDTAESVKQGLKDPDHNYDKKLETLKRLGGQFDLMDYSAYGYGEYNYDRDENDEEKKIILPDSKKHKAYYYCPNDNRIYLDMELVDENTIQGPQRIMFIFQEYLKYDNHYDKVLPIDVILYAYDVARGVHDDDDDPVFKFHPKWYLEDYPHMFSTCRF